MDYSALNEAKKRLKRTEAAALALQEADRYEPASEAWSAFLGAANTVYSKLEQGAKNSPSSRQWFAGKKRERRLDPLLQYIHQARNAEEHNIQPVLLVSIDVDIGPPFGRVTISGNGDFDPVGDTPVPSPRFAMQTVVNSKYGDKFEPPRTHLGVPIANNPKVVAEAAVAYLQSLIMDAEARVTNAPPPLRGKGPPPPP
jgi:hypothetical protein